MKLQDTLTFETLEPEEVLKRAKNFEQINCFQWRFKSRMPQQQ